MYFVGIDLAWSERNATGLCVLDGNQKQSRYIASSTVYSDDEILDFISKQVGKENAFIAIDAPLIVPNETGRRVAEAKVGELFRKYNAGAHPANRQRLSSFTGSIRGEVLSKKLEEKKFIHNPMIKKHENSRKFFEVYPHPSMVVLFNLQKVIPYKLKPNRDNASRWNAFNQYLKYMKQLETKIPKLVLPKAITSKKIEELTGNKLKSFEDELDGIFCAYLAYYNWKCPERCEVLGSMKEGYILTPVFEEMKQQLKEKSKQTTL